MEGKDHHLILLRMRDIGTLLSSLSVEPAAGAEGIGVAGLGGGGRLPWEGEGEGVGGWRWGRGTKS